MKLFLNLIFLMVFGVGFSQNNTSYWQQKADYKIAIDLDVETHQYKGVQELTTLTTHLILYIGCFIIYTLMLSSQEVKWT